MPLRMRWILAAALGLGATAGQALAHPHVWIEMRSDVVFGGTGQIEAVNIEWVFDDGYAQVALDGLDADGDGNYSQAELEPLTRENMASLKDYEYFVVMRANGEKLAIGDAAEAGQIYSNGRLSLHFRVPLKSPVDPMKGEFMLKVYDPEFFIAIDYAKDNPVSAIGTMPASCRIDLGPIPSDSEVEQTRLYLSTKGQDWQPENGEDFGAMFAQPLGVKCGT